jgi:hypothetical protein
MRISKTIRVAVIALLAITVAGVSSCKKEDKILGSKTYTMSTYNSSGITGTVEFKEKSDGTTTVNIKMWGTTNGAEYPAHIHMGPVTAPGSVQIDFSPIVSTGTTAEKSQDISNKYSDMLVYDGCFVAHEPGNLANYVLVGNIGKNAM